MTFTRTGRKWRTAIWNYYEVKCDSCGRNIKVAAGGPPFCRTCDPKALAVPTELKSDAINN